MPNCTLATTNMAMDTPITVAMLRLNPAMLIRVAVSLIVVSLKHFKNELYLEVIADHDQDSNYW